jgi:peptidoglycan/xylan/chitin deacetylase (PgdA/CDA1 family)
VINLQRSAPPEDWRSGAAALAVLSFDVDAEAPILVAGAHYAEDLSAMSHQAYGPRVGVPRLLEMLARVEVPATFFVPGVTAERWPHTVEAILEAGHEVALHSYSHRRLPGMPADEQRADFEQGLAALRRLGAEPVGYRAPLWQQTEVTLQLVGEAGFAYDSSLMDDDRPYLFSAGGRTLAELPVHWSLDDWEQYAFLPDPPIGHNIETTDKVLRLWTSELDAMRATGSLCLITCHPFLSGRPSRVAALERFVAAAREHGDVAFDRCDRLARRLVVSA